MSDERNRPRGPLDPLEVPRFAGPSTFARLPTLDEVGRADVVGYSFPVRLSRSMIIRISGESRSERRISHGA